MEQLTDASRQVSATAQQIAAPPAASPSWPGTSRAPLPRRRTPGDDAARGGTVRSVDAARGRATATLGAEHVLEVAGSAARPRAGHARHGRSASSNLRVTWRRSSTPAWSCSGWTPRRRPPSPSPSITSFGLAALVGRRRCPKWSRSATTSARSELRRHLRWPAPARRRRTPVVLDIDALLTIAHGEPSAEPVQYAERRQHRQVSRVVRRRGRHPVWPGSTGSSCGVDDTGGRRRRDRRAVPRSPHASSGRLRSVGFDDGEHLPQHALEERPRSNCVSNDASPTPRWPMSCSCPSIGSSSCVGTVHRRAPDRRLRAAATGAALDGRSWTSHGARPRHASGRAAARIDPRCRSSDSTRSAPGRRSVRSAPLASGQMVHERLGGDPAQVAEIAGLVAGLERPARPGDAHPDGADLHGHRPDAPGRAGSGTIVGQGRAVAGGGRADRARAPRPAAAFRRLVAPGAQRGRPRDRTCRAPRRREEAVVRHGPARQPLSSVRRS